MASILDLQRKIEARKMEERVMDAVNLLNENIIKSGKLLQEYMAVQASYQDDLSNQFNSIVKQKEKMIEKLSDQANLYSSKLYEQRKEVIEQVDAYKVAVAEWQKKLQIKAALEIASNLFSLGFSIATPASSISALAKLGETVQKIQKAVNIFNAVIKTYTAIENLPNNPQSVIDTLNNLGSGMLNLPTSLEWDEIKINMDYTLNTGPDISAKASLSAAFSILVLRGKALIEVQNELQQRLVELASAKSQLRLHAEQKNRLAQLKMELQVEPANLNKGAIDLVGKIGQLIFFERQMLLIMASTIAIQNRALQYEYLQQTQAINVFSFPKLQLAILSQSQSITMGLTVQPFPESQPDPIIYEVHGVKSSSVINSNYYTFSIPLNSREFSSYNYVRVEKVSIEIGGILSTDTGKYYAELCFDGNPFYDRGFNGELLTFRTVSRLYTSKHDVCRSVHCYDESTDVASYDEGLVTLMAGTKRSFDGSLVSRITPFSSWSVSLPPTDTNKNIQFDHCPRGLTIRLIFKIFAQLKESAIHTSREESVKQAGMLRNRSTHLIKRRLTQPKLEEFHVGIHGLQSTSHVSATQSELEEGHVGVHGLQSTSYVSTSEVLEMMQGKSVCAGWDVVLSLTANQVNDNLYDQYTDRVNCPKFMRSTGDVEYQVTTSTGVKTKTFFNFEFKAPHLEFLLNNSNSAHVGFPINLGHYEYSIEVNNKWVMIEKADVTDKDNYYLQGDVPLAHLQGTVSSEMNIAVKLNEGAFSADNFSPGTSNPMMNAALTKYFTGLKDGYELYTLGTLDTTNITLLAALTPESFKFNVYIQKATETFFSFSLSPLVQCQVLSLSTFWSPFQLIMNAHL